MNTVVLDVNNYICDKTLKTLNLVLLEAEDRSVYSLDV